jgi:hypothetical protein
MTERRPSRQDLRGIQRSMAAALLQGQRYPAYPLILRALKRFDRLRKRSAITRAAKYTRSGLWVQGRIRGRRYKLWLARRERFWSLQSSLHWSPGKVILHKQLLVDFFWRRRRRHSRLRPGVYKGAAAARLTRGARRLARYCKGSPRLTWRVLDTIERGCQRCRKLIQEDRAVTQVAKELLGEYYAR